MYKGINRTDQSDPIMLLICLASANPVFPRAAQAIPAGNSPTSRAVRMANPETVSPSRDLSVSVQIRKVLLLTPLFAIDPNNYGMQNRHTKKADFRLKVSLDTREEIRTPDQLCVRQPLYH